MRIFLKDIAKSELELVNNFPIQGLLFTVQQSNAELVREIVEEAPFYVTILGETKPFPKYELEELIFFCKLQGLIIMGYNTVEDLSCPVIINSEHKPYNVLLKRGNNITTDYFCTEQLWNEADQVIALILTKDEFIEMWPKIKNFWLSL